MNWVKKKNLPTIESILYEGQSCNTLLDLWHILHSSYNSAENRPINASFLNETPQANQILWPPFSKQEFKDTIAKCSSSSTPSLDCHDLANWLSHYLYFFSFLFLFITTRWSVGKYYVTLSQCHNGVTEGHRWSQSQWVT